MGPFLADGKLDGRDRGAGTIAYHSEGGLVAEVTAQALFDIGESRWWVGWR